MYKGFPFFLFYYFVFFFVFCIFLFFSFFASAFRFFCFYFLGTVFLIFLVFKKFSLIFEEKVIFFSSFSKSQHKSGHLFVRTLGHHTMLMLTVSKCVVSLVSDAAARSLRC